MESKLTQPERDLLATMSENWCRIKKRQVRAAQLLRQRGLVESKHVFSSSLGWRVVEHTPKANPHG